MWESDARLRQVYVDAAMRSRLGKCGLGVIVRDPRGRVHQCWGALATRMTNCEAEYAAAIFALRRLRSLGFRTVTICSDSLVMVDQITGRAATRALGLRRKKEELLDLLRDFDSVCFQHIPREHNRLADALANDVADGRVPPIEVYRAR
jgi:ribonuclease HI